MIAISITNQDLPLSSALTHAKSMLIVCDETTRLVLSYHTANNIIDVYLSRDKYGLIKEEYELADMHATDLEKLPLDTGPAPV